MLYNHYIEFYPDVPWASGHQWNHGRCMSDQAKVRGLMIFNRPATNHPTY